MNLKKVFLTSALVLLASNSVAAPDEAELGRDRGYPVAPGMATHIDEHYRIGSMSNMEKVYKYAIVKASGPVRPLPARNNPPDIRFFANKRQQGISDLLNDNRITSLLLMQDGEVVVEKYQYDRKPEHRFTSYSMAKTITGILVGAALKDGYIKSLDDSAETYVSDLKGTDFGKVTIRNLLRMSSGIKWSEPEDSAAMSGETYKQKGRGGASVIRHLRSRVEQGTEFNYSSADTFALTLVVRAATGKSLADYTSEKLWSKIGAESDASWMVDWSGTEVGYAYFNATLRDYGRLAQFFNEGLPGVVSEDYLMEMTSGDRAPDYLFHRKISLYHGYGYQTWFLPYKTRTFAMLGLHGQFIVMQPDTGIVIVMTSARKAPRGDLKQFLYDIGMIHGMLRSLNGDLAMYPEVGK